MSIWNLWTRMCYGGFPWMQYRHTGARSILIVFGQIKATPLVEVCRAGIPGGSSSTDGSGKKRRFNFFQHTEFFSSTEPSPFRSLPMHLNSVWEIRWKIVERGIPVPVPKSKPRPVQLRLRPDDPPFPATRFPKLSKNYNYVPLKNKGLCQGWFHFYVLMWSPS